MSIMPKWLVPEADGIFPTGALWRQWRHMDKKYVNKINKYKSGPITTEDTSSNPAHGEVYSIEHYVVKWFVTGQWFSLDSPVSSTSKTDLHDITELLLNVALISITLTLTP